MPPTIAAPRVHDTSLSLQDASAAVVLRDIAELRSFRQPPASVCQVLEALLIILGIPDAAWAQTRRRLDASLVQRINSLDEPKLARKSAERLHRLLQSSAFIDGTLREKCPAAAPLADWCKTVGRLCAKPSPRPSPQNSGRPGSAPPGTSAARRQAPLAGTLPPSAGGSVMNGVLSGKVDEGTMGDRRGAVPKSSLATPGETQLDGAEAQSCQQSPPCTLQLDSLMVFGDGMAVSPNLGRLGEAQLSRVQDLQILREGVGQVTFCGETDCRGLLSSLEDIIIIERGEVVVYPEACLKPPVGEGLNKPASIVLFGCMPKSQARLSDQKARDRYRQRVAQMTEEKGATFEDYDCEDGTWKFSVTHF